MTITDQALSASRDFMSVANRLPTLYKLDEQCAAILALQDLDDYELEELGYTREDLRQQEEALLQALLDKAESYGIVLKEMNRIAQDRRDEVRRMQERAISAEKTVERLKERFADHMRATGQQRIETPKFTFRLQPNPRSVVIQDEAAIPQEFLIVTYTPSKTAIRDHIKATGQIPDGVIYESSGDSLRVS